MLVTIMIFVILGFLWFVLVAAAQHTKLTEIHAELLQIRVNTSMPTVINNSMNEPRG